MPQWPYIKSNQCAQSGGCVVLSSTTSTTSYHSDDGLVTICFVCKYVICGNIDPRNTGTHRHPHFPTPNHGSQEEHFPFDAVTAGGSQGKRRRLMSGMCCVRLFLLGLYKPVQKEEIHQLAWSWRKFSKKSRASELDRCALSEAKVKEGGEVDMDSTAKQHALPMSAEHKRTVSREVASLKSSLNYETPNKAKARDIHSGYLSASHTEHQAICARALGQTLQQGGFANETLAASQLEQLSLSVAEGGSAGPRFLLPSTGDGACGCNSTKMQIDWFDGRLRPKNTYTSRSSGPFKKRILAYGRNVICATLKRLVLRANDVNPDDGILIDQNDAEVNIAFSIFIEELVKAKFNTFCQIGELVLAASMEGFTGLVMWLSKHDQPTARVYRLPDLLVMPTMVGGMLPNWAQPQVIDYSWLEYALVPTDEGKQHLVPVFRERPSSL